MDPNLNLEAGGCEENDATKNRIKARKFNAMLKAGQLPSWLATAWEKTLEMGPGKQDRQRMLVNAAFDHKNGRLILNVDKPIFRDVQKTYQKTEASDKSKSLTKLLFKKKWNLTEEEFAQGLADKEFYEVTDAAGKLKYGWDVSEHSTTRGKEGSSAVEAIHEGNRQDAKFFMQLAGDWKIGLFSKSSSSKSGMLALHDSDKEINPEQWKQAQKQLNLGMAACERLHQSAKKLLQVIGVDAKEDELWSKLLLGQEMQNGQDITPQLYDTLMAEVGSQCEMLEEDLAAIRAQVNVRNARQQAESAENSAESALSILLMTYLAQGVLSGACVHAIAVAAKHDLSKAEQGYCLPKLDALAKIKHGKNLQQSVLNKLSQETNLPKPAEVDVPLAGGPSNVASSCIMLPHELFSAFFSDEAAWARSVLPEDRLEQFWDAFEHHPCMEGHPVKAVKDWKGRCCPLSLHGDEVPVQGVGKIWCRSALMISWASLIAIACGKGVSDCQIYIYGLFEKFIQSEAPGIPGTMSVLWQILQWSFQCIWDGTFPARDWRGIPFPRESPEWKKAGQRLAGKYFGCLVQLCGDLDYYAKWLGVPHYGSHSAPCSQCRCTYRGALSWLDCRSNSPWYGFIAVPLEQANKIYEGALRMTQLHCQLQEYYETSGRKIFNITTKTHFCLHSLWLARHIHPSIVWCYKGEATMQRLQKLWKSCLDGKKHWQVGKVAAHKERYLLHVKAKL
ncbi:unnamed protein product [Effrenium voratum]|nr:unnamed protein product [Effrenium voratum]